MDWTNEANDTVESEHSTVLVLKDKSSIHTRVFGVEYLGHEYQIISQITMTSEGKLTELRYGSTEFSLDKNIPNFVLTAKQELVRDSYDNFQFALQLDLLTNRSDIDLMPNSHLLIKKEHKRRGTTFFHPLFRADKFLKDMIVLVEQGAFAFDTRLIATNWAPDKDHFADNFHMFHDAYQKLGKVKEFKGKENEMKRLKEASRRTWTGKKLTQMGYAPMDVRTEKELIFIGKIDFAQAIFKKQEDF